MTDNEIIGVDAGGTWIKAARFREDLREVSRTKLPSGAGKSKEAYVDSIVDAVDELGDGPVALGLSLPGLFRRDREVLEHSPNVKGMPVGGTGLDLKNEIGKRVKTDRVVGDNDAACAALGEWAHGRCNADPTKTLLHLTWGTGIGVGVVIDGVAQFGWEGGHLPLSHDKKKGSWILVPGADLERQIAVPALVKKAKDLFETGEYQTKLEAKDLEDTRHVSVLLNQYVLDGDELAEKVLGDSLGGMAWCLHMMSVLAYPELVTLGGAMSGDWLLTNLRQEVAERSKGFLVDSLQPDMVQLAELGNDAGMVGAAMLARQKFLK